MTAEAIHYDQLVMMSTPRSFLSCNPAGGYGAPAVGDIVEFDGAGDIIQMATEANSLGVLVREDESVDGNWVVAVADCVINYDELDYDGTTEHTANEALLIRGIQVLDQPTTVTLP